MGRFLFSFRGRINRAQYWGFVLLCYAVGAIIGIVIHETLTKDFIETLTKDFDFRDPRAWTLVAFGDLLFFLFVYSSLAVSAKRLHDRGKRAWPRLLAMYAGPWLIGIAALQTPNPNAGAFAILLTYAAFFAVYIYAFIALGCRRGTEGPNQYGPDPLAREGTSSHGGEHRASA